MQIETWAANRLAEEMAALLSGGRVDVLDAAGNLLANCQFSTPAFQKPIAGSVAANPFLPAIAKADGVPDSFLAYDPAGSLVLAGTAGYKDNQPTPEMRFKTRQIIEGADVLVEEFIFSVITEAQ